MSRTLKFVWAVFAAAWAVDIGLWCLRAYDHVLFVHVMQTYFAWLP